MTPLRIAVVAAATILVTLPFGLEAAMYKWVDERGVVNYSNTPPKGRTSARVVPDSQRVSVVPPPPPEQLARERELIAESRLARLERRIDALQSPPPMVMSAPSVPEPYYGPGYATYGYGYGFPAVAYGRSFIGGGFGFGPGFVGRPHLPPGIYPPGYGRRAGIPPYADNNFRGPPSGAAIHRGPGFAAGGFRR